MLFKHAESLLSNLIDGDYYSLYISQIRKLKEFPCSPVVKNLSWNAGDRRELDPWSGNKILHDREHLKPRATSKT